MPGTGNGLGKGSEVFLLVAVAHSLGPGSGLPGLPDLSGCCCPFCCGNQWELVPEEARVQERKG